MTSGCARTARRTGTSERRSRTPAGYQPGPGTGRVALASTGLVHVALGASVPAAMATGGHWQAALGGEGFSAGEWCRRHGLL